MSTGGPQGANSMGVGGEGVGGRATFWPCLPITRQANSPGAEGLEVGLPGDGRAQSISTCRRTEPHQRGCLQKEGETESHEPGSRKASNQCPYPTPAAGLRPCTGPRYVLVQVSPEALAPSLSHPAPGRAAPLRPHCAQTREVMYTECTRSASVLCRSCRGSRPCTLLLRL